MSSHKSPTSSQNSIRAQIYCFWLFDRVSPKLASPTSPRSRQFSWKSCAAAEPTPTLSRPKDSSDRPRTAPHPLARQFELALVLVLLGPPRTRTPRKNMALVLWIYCNRNEIEWGKKRLFMGRTGEKNMVWSGPFVGILAKRKLIPIFTGEVMDVLGIEACGAEMVM